MSNTNLAIHLPDLRIARQFYTGVLGFETLEETEDRLLLSGSLTLYVVKDEGTMPFILALASRDLDEAWRHLETNGGKIFRDWTPSLEMARGNMGVAC